MRDKQKIMFVVQTLIVILISVLGYLWHGVNTQLQDMSQRLRTVELNNVKILTLLNAEPIADNYLSKQPQTPEYTLKNTICMAAK